MRGPQPCPRKLEKSVLERPAPPTLPTLELNQLLSCICRRGGHGHTAAQEIRNCTALRRTPTLRSIPSHPTSSHARVRPTASPRTPDASLNDLGEFHVRALSRENAMDVKTRAHVLLRRPLISIPPWHYSTSQHIPTRYRPHTEQQNYQADHAGGGGGGAGSLGGGADPGAAAAIAAPVASVVPAGYPA